MKQIIQDLRSGDVKLVEVPPPMLKPGGVLVNSCASVISAGTERMVMELASKSLVGKARARPDLVKQVIAKARKEGLRNTYRAVQSRLDDSMPLGYSAAGTVEEVGAEVLGLKPGDRVAVAGGGYASHAEINFIPLNLVARIPDSVSFSDAAYSTIASIAMQGVRLADTSIGENVAVIGLGLIGLITVQILKAGGCRVIGVDIDPAKVELGRTLGLDAAVGDTDSVDEAVAVFTQGRGVDHTIITASTKSNDPVVTAGEVTRRRGRVVIVGAVGMEIPRNLYYHKELSLQVSMSYGPGRYDSSYEEHGIDYPFDYVRWTEQRNLESVLHLMESGRLNVAALTTHTYSFDRALDAYDLIKKASEPYVGIVLEYGDRPADVPDSTVVFRPRADHRAGERLRVGFVGAGNYATLHLLPRLQNSEVVDLTGIVTATGSSAHQTAGKFGFQFATTDVGEILSEGTDAVFIASRHSSHSDLAVRALNSGKHVFVEKPMAVTPEQLVELKSAYERANGERPTGFMVGQNRRFSPMVRELRERMPAGQPMQMVYRVNSGAIPTDSWLHEPEEGSGMLVGEACHFFDVMQYMCGAPAEVVYARQLRLGRTDVADHDNILVTVSFRDGSAGVLVYNTVGDKGAPKERFETYSGGSVGILDDFRVLEVHREGKRHRSKSSQDKGQSAQIEETIESFRSRGQGPVPFEVLCRIMAIVFAAQQSLRTGEPVRLDS